MKNRLDHAEDRLGKLQIQQEVLGSTHETLNSEVTGELVILKTKIDAMKPEVSEVADSVTTLTTATSHLSPTAPTFVPSSQSPGMGGGAEAWLKECETCSIQGESLWEAYLTQFKLLLELNHWTEQQKATYLTISLRGQALTVLTNLPKEQHGDFTALATALKNRFGNNHHTELNRAHLRSHAKK